MEKQFHGNLKLYYDRGDPADTYAVSHSCVPSHVHAFPFSQVVINPEWQDMAVLVSATNDRQKRGFHSIYRKPQEGGLPAEQRRITAYIEADHQHVASIINFAACYLWSSLVDVMPQK